MADMFGPQATQLSSPRVQSQALGAPIAVEGDSSLATIIGGLTQALNIGAAIRGQAQVEKRSEVTAETFKTLDEEGKTALIDLGFDQKTINQAASFAEARAQLPIGSAKQALLEAKLQTTMNRMIQARPEHSDMIISAFKTQRDLLSPVRKQSLELERTIDDSMMTNFGYLPAQGASLEEKVANHSELMAAKARSDKAAATLKRQKQEIDLRSATLTLDKKEQEARDDAIRRVSSKIVRVELYNDLLNNGIWKRVDKSLGGVFKGRLSTGTLMAAMAEGRVSQTDVLQIKNQLLQDRTQRENTILREHGLLGRDSSELKQLREHYDGLVSLIDQQANEATSLSAKNQRASLYLTNTNIATAPVQAQTQVLNALANTKGLINGEELETLTEQVARNVVSMSNDAMQKLAQILPQVGSYQDKRTSFETAILTVGNAEQDIKNVYRASYTSDPVTADLAVINKKEVISNKAKMTLQEVKKLKQEQMDSQLGALNIALYGEYSDSWKAATTVGGKQIQVFQPVTSGGRLDVVMSTEYKDALNSGKLTKQQDDTIKAQFQIVQSNLKALQLSAAATKVMLHDTRATELDTLKALGMNPDEVLNFNIDLSDLSREKRGEGPGFFEKADRVIKAGDKFIRGISTGTQKLILGGEQELAKLFEDLTNRGLSAKDAEEFLQGLGSGAAIDQVPDSSPPTMNPTDVEVIKEQPKIVTEDGIAP